MLLCPRISPENTEVGCHFLLHGIFLISRIEPGPPALKVDSLPSEPPEEVMLVALNQMAGVYLVSLSFS